ncbi:MAG: glycosyltransferase family 39 protein, partial [Candidatus Lloydbacteria bacterium]|nr:glycosyltransferase family 39 protein [Candidatus Lloydbacteria bacterium]
LLLSLIWYTEKNNLFGAGFFLGLAVISKPSVYVFFIPAFVILLLFEKATVVYLPRLTSGKAGLWMSLLLVFVFINIFSLSTLTTKPALWYDEGINIELARNFSEFGKLDLMVRPMQFSGQGALIGSTGYTATVPLAAFFKLFGFGLPQARVYMLLWMNIMLFCLFYFARKKWGVSVALATLFLVATFAPFFGNGRSVMGEIPGFTFLLLSLIWYTEKNNLFGAGFFLGLAVISKPSVYVFFIPAFVILLLFEKWKSLGAHASNPYEQAQVTSLINIKNNLAAFFESPTLLYFLLFAIIIISALYIKRDFYEQNKQIIILTASYGILEFFYYLKSLGYLRYLIALQFLIFILLVPALETLARRFAPPPYGSIAIRACMAILVLFQAAYLFSGAKLFYSDNSQKTFQYLENNFEGQIIGIVNLPTIASLIPPTQRMQTISTYGLDKVGEHPLSLAAEALPPVIVFENNHAFEPQYAEVLKQHYLPEQTIGNILIYRKY